MIGLSAVFTPDGRRRARFTLKLNMKCSGIVVRVANAIAGTILMSLPIWEVLVQKGQNRQVVVGQREEGRESETTSFIRSFHMTTRGATVSQYQKFEP